MNHRIHLMVGLVYQCIALGLTPSSAFFVAAHMLRSIERKEGTLGEPNRPMSLFVETLCR
jgi:hypothetical protein